MTSLGFNQTNISCIIPVYNEAERVGKVLDAVVGHELINEIVVINDGSTDESEPVLQKWTGIKLISYAKNQGKSHAIMVGLKEATNDFVLMIDSDLVGLDKRNITELVEPVLQNKADVSMSLRKNSLLVYKLFGLDFVSGERCFRKQMIVESIDKLDHIPGFALETLLNQIIVAKKLRLRVVKWNNVTLTNKTGKIGFWKGIKGEIRMVLQIISFLTVPKILKLYVKMLSLKV